MEIKPFIFTRYCLREVGSQFLLIASIIGSILIVSQFIRLSEILLNFGISLENLFLPVMFVVFPIVAFVLPLAFFFAVYTTFSRFSADGEWIAVQSAGYSLARAALPITAMAVIVSIIGSGCSLWLEPWGQRELHQFFKRKVQQEIDSFLDHRLKPGVFIDDFLGFTIYAEEISPDKRLLKNVMLTSGSGEASNQGPFKMFAPKAEIKGSVRSDDLEFLFSKAIMYVDAGPEEVDIVRMEYSRWDLIRLFEKQFFRGQDESEDYRALSPPDLIEWIAAAARIDPDAAPVKRATFLLHHRASLPLSALSFCWLAMIFAIQSNRSTRAFATLSAIGALMGGYLIIMGGKMLADKLVVDPILAAWLPHALVIAFSGILLGLKSILPPSEPLFSAIFRKFSPRKRMG